MAIFPTKKFKRKHQRFADAQYNLFLKS